MKRSSKVFGIDLGTTYSCISYVDEYGKAIIVPNRNGERTTPSVVCFDKGSASVGSVAKGYADVEPENVCAYIKRQMGNDDYTAQFNGVEYTPEEISSFILRKIAQDASEYLGEEVHDVVITCPAYFFVKERNATKRAGELAGLNVLQIVNEPTAAAVAYGYNEESNVKTALVYDLGGGTFDVTVMRFSPEAIEAICTDGDHRLGGKDWDDRLAALIAQKFCEITGCQTDPLDDPETQAQLLIDAEIAKKALSVRMQTKVRVTHAGERANIEVTRDEFEEITRDLLQRTVDFTRSVINIAQEREVTVEEILLVGGSSKMWAVESILQKEFNLPIRLYDPDEAVAKGAAIIGNNLRLRKLVENKLSDGKRDTDLVIEDVAAETGYTLETVAGAMRVVKNVASKSFGKIVIYDTDRYDAYCERIKVTGESYDYRNPESGERAKNIIFKNTPLPATRVGYTETLVENQSALAERLCENQASEEESVNGVDVALCNIIFEGSIKLPPGLPASQTIKTTFTLDEDGLLLCTVEVDGTDVYDSKYVQTGKARSATELKIQEERCSELIIKD